MSCLVSTEQPPAPTPCEHSQYLADLLWAYKDVFPLEEEERKQCALTCYSSDAQYMRNNELKFLLKNIRELASMQLYQCVTKVSTLKSAATDGTQGNDAANGKPPASATNGSTAVAPAAAGGRVTTTTADVAGIRRRIAEAEERLEQVVALISSRLQAGEEAIKAREAQAAQNEAKSTPAVSNSAAAIAKKPPKGKKVAATPASAPALPATTPTPTPTPISNGGRPYYSPKLLQYCRRMRFTRAETDLFHLMCIVQGSSSPHVLNSLFEEDYLRRLPGFQRICGLSEVDIELFCDPERQHIKEGLAVVEEDHGVSFSLRIPRTAVQIFLGKPVCPEDLLKVSATVLEEIILSEDVGAEGEEGEDYLSKHVGGGEADEGYHGGDNDSDGDCVDRAVHEDEAVEAAGGKRKRGKEATGGKKAGGAGAAAAKKKPRVKVDTAAPNDAPTKKPMGSAATPPVGSAGGSGGRTSSTEYARMLRSLLGSNHGGSGGRERSGSDSAQSSAAMAAAALLSSPEIAAGIVGADNKLDQKALQRLLRNNGASAPVAVPGTNGSASDSAAAASGSGTEEGADGDADGDGGDSVMGDAPMHDDVAVLAAAAAAAASTSTSMSSASSSFAPYSPTNQLEYLEEGFQLIALMVRGNAARLKDDLKKEGTRINQYDGGGNEFKQGKRELLAKLRVAERKVSRRVQCTRRCGLQLPRLELLAERLGLDSFERKLILLLIGKTVSPVVRTLMDTLADGSSSTRYVDDVISVGQALAILCQDFQAQIASRSYFYRSGRLLTNGIIFLSRPRWHTGSGDLTDQKMSIDRRLLDWCVGLDSEINELVEGSALYKPKVSLDQIVLPPGEIEVLVQQCRAYDDFCRYRVASGMKDVISYGNGLVVLFCGKSGTGKTMTVNAIANELNKSVLLVDFSSLTGKRDSNNSELDADLRGLFREANMANALLFFDECEVAFRNRNHGGGDRMLNSLLTEIEKHEGIVFMATNRPYDIDEAMHRRINSVIEFRPPDHVMRRAIMANLLGIQKKPMAGGEEGRAAAASSSGVTASSAYKLNLAADVDIDALAVKYELTGGFIKNAVISAMLCAVSRCGPSVGEDGPAIEPVLTQSDLVLGCKLQMRGNLSQESSRSRKLVAAIGGGSEASRGLDDIVLVPKLRSALDAVVRYEKTRGCVYGSWAPDATLFNTNPLGSIADLRASANKSSAASASAGGASDAKNRSLTGLEQCACIVAFAGPKGSGKHTVANCLGVQLGRPVRTVHIVDVLSGGRGAADALAGIEHALNDARLADALVVLDGFEHIIDDNGGTGGSGGGESGSGGHGVGGFKLSTLLSRLLDTLITFPGCVILHCNVENPNNIVLQRDFASALFSFIRFSVPPADVRSVLWQRLVPSRTPLYQPAEGAEMTSTTTLALANKEGFNSRTGGVIHAINYSELGKRFELTASCIRNAVARACAEAAYRLLSNQQAAQSDAPTESAGSNVSKGVPAATASGVKDKSSAAKELAACSYLTHSDLVAAAEAEVAKVKGGGSDAMMHLFV